MGENNVKGHLFISVILTRIEAMENGINPEPVVLKTAQKSLFLCYELLSMRINGSLSADTISSSVLQDLGGPQDFVVDFTVQDWSMDRDIQVSWFQSGHEDGAWWRW